GRSSVLDNPLVGESKVSSLQHPFQQVVLASARRKVDLCRRQTRRSDGTSRLHRCLPPAAPLRGFRLSLPVARTHRFLLSLRFGPSGFLPSRTPVLWPLLTPADSAQPPGCGYEVTSHIPQASPDKSVIFPPATTGVYRTGPWRLWISSCLGDLSDRFCLKSSSCTLARAFASVFIQIPPRGRHACLCLMVGARQPPFRTLTVEMTPMLGVQAKNPRTGVFYPAPVFQDGGIQLSSSSLLTSWTKAFTACSASAPSALIATSVPELMARLMMP